MSIHEPIVSRALPARAIPSLNVATERGLQIALGLIWLFDGALQLQPFMFGRGFVTQVIAPNEVDQPGFVAAPIRLIADLIEPRVALFNLFAVTIQLLIGLGLMHRPTVKPALVTSLAWALGIWWIGEGLGGLLTGHASPLTGAPARRSCTYSPDSSSGREPADGHPEHPLVASWARGQPAASGRQSGSDRPRSGCCRQPRHRSRSRRHR